MCAPVPPRRALEQLEPRLGDHITVFPSRGRPVTRTLVSASLKPRSAPNSPDEGALSLVLDLACGNQRFGPQLRRINLAGDRWLWPVAPLWVESRSTGRRLFIGVSGGA